MIFICRKDSDIALSLILHLTVQKSVRRFGLATHRRFASSWRDELELEIQAYATEACGSLLQFRVYPPTSRLPRNCTWGLAQADRHVSSHLHIRLLPPRQPPITRQSNGATNTTAERRVGVRVARNVFKATGSVRLGRVQLAFCTENHLPPTHFRSHLPWCAFHDLKVVSGAFLSAPSSIDVTREASHCWRCKPDRLQSHE